MLARGYRRYTGKSETYPLLFGNPLDFVLPIKEVFRCILCYSLLRPDEVVIVNRITGEKKPVDVMIGLGKCSGRAVYDPKILKY